MRKVDAETAFISTVAGNGDSGYDDKNMGGCGAARFVAKESAGTVKHGDGLLAIEAVVNSPVGIDARLSRASVYLRARREQNSPRQTVLMLR